MVHKNEPNIVGWDWLSIIFQDYSNICLRAMMDHSFGNACHRSSCLGYRWLQCMPDHVPDKPQLVVKTNKFKWNKSVSKRKIFKNSSNMTANSPEVKTPIAKKATMKRTNVNFILIWNWLRNISSLKIFFFEYTDDSMLMLNDELIQSSWALRIYTEIFRLSTHMTTLMIKLSIVKCSIESIEWRKKKP